jgi:hypothetical protein
MATRTHTGFLLIARGGFGQLRAGQSVADSAIDGTATTATGTRR